MKIVVIETIEAAAFVPALGTDPERERIAPALYKFDILNEIQGSKIL